MILARYRTIRLRAIVLICFSLRCKHLHARTSPCSHITNGFHAMRQKKAAVLRRLSLSLSSSPTKNRRCNLNASSIPCSSALTLACAADDARCPEWIHCVRFPENFFPEYSFPYSFPY